jgi:hypothetical protein
VQALFTLLSKWVFCYTHHVVQELLVQTEEMQAFVEQANRRLRGYVEEDEERAVTPLHDIMGVITSVRKKCKDTERLFEPWAGKMELLRHYGVELPAWVLTHISTGTLVTYLVTCRPQPRICGSTGHVRAACSIQYAHPLSLSLSLSLSLTHTHTQSERKIESV